MFIKSFIFISLLFSSHIFALEIPACNVEKEDLIVIFDNSMDMWGLDQEFENWFIEREDHPRMPLAIESVTPLSRGAKTMFVLSYKSSAQGCSSRTECSIFGNKLLNMIFDSYLEGRADVTLGCDQAVSPFPRLSVGNN
ncbi:MAG: hypothetical protein CME63_00525 [Halobacteriovoraceae bacterium]|nr:hypothetical protein [Halobacteriovoraceae bacterium]|tara:strand:- start:116916 stop:117332 length:417 start_codon:yes stop_codon:yes gene_type:complete